MDEISQPTLNATSQDSQQVNKFPTGDQLSSITVLTRKGGKDVELNRAGKRNFFRLLRKNNVALPYSPNEIIHRQKAARIAANPPDNRPGQNAPELDNRMRSRCLNLKAGNSSRFFAAPPEPRRPLVHNILGDEQLAILAGDGGTGKGFLVLDLAISIAAGLPFLGNPDFSVAQPGGVLVINVEDDLDEIHRRIWTCFHTATANLPHSEAAQARRMCEENIHIPPASRFAFTLSGEHRKPNKQALIEYACEIPNLKLIVLDPANLLLLDDFNRSEVVSQFLLDLKDIATATNACILLVSHKNKGSSTGDLEHKQAAASVLGSVSFVNTARLVLSASILDKKTVNSLDLPPQRNHYVAFGITKANYLEHHGQQAILERMDGGALRFVRYDDNCHTSSVVLTIISANPGISQADIIIKAKDQSGLPREAVLHSIQELVSDEKIDIQKGDNNTNHHFPVSA